VSDQHIADARLARISKLVEICGVEHAIAHVAVSRRVIPSGAFLVLLLRLAFLQSLQEQFTLHGWIAGGVSVAQTVALR
jgi:hypothetical protein